MDYLALPHKGTNPLKHHIWNVWPGHRRVPTLSRNTKDYRYYIEFLAWPHKGFSTSAINTQKLIQSCTDYLALHATKKLTKNNTELHAWSMQGYQPLKHTLGLHCMPGVVT